MKKLYTLMLAAASASMMFAGMPIMQHQVSFGMPTPVQMPTEKTELVKLFNQAAPMKSFNSMRANTKFNAPSRAESTVSREEFCKMDFSQNYSTFLQNENGRIDVEFCGDLYFKEGKGDAVVMTGLLGCTADNIGADFSITGTYDAASQTLTFPYEQTVYKSNSMNVIFTGFGYVLSEDKTEVVDAIDFTAEDSLVLSMEDFYGQKALQVEGAWDNSWDIIPAFGFLAVDPRTDEGMGWFDLTVGETFYIAQANANIEYEYVHFYGDGNDDYEILDYNGYGLLNIMKLNPDDEAAAIQVGPFIQIGFGCPVMFTLDYGQYVAYDTYQVGKNEYKNPAYMEIANDSYYYLFELTESSNELGIYLNITADENGVFEAAEFDCQMWAALDEVSGYWWGYCFPAYITPRSFETAAVSTIVSDKAQDGRWFNLQGIEVNKDNLQKGNIYINNGKKVLVK